MGTESFDLGARVVEGVSAATKRDVIAGTVEGVAGTRFEPAATSSSAIATLNRMNDAVVAKYEALGGVAALGEPVHKEIGHWTFAASCISYDAASDAAYEIHGEIYQHWLRLGGPAFGTPCTDETATPDGVGRFNHFNGGTASIYWTPSTGARAIYGAIRAKWAELGWERQVGYPVTDETGTPDGVGRFNHFSNGGSIYWTPATGAHHVYGAIRERWSALGWETGYLGYPTTDEMDFPEGGRITEFEHGAIYWWPDTGPIDLRGVAVQYTGLVCFGETDWDQSSDSDEPYALISVTTPEIAHTVRTQVYEDVDDGESRPDLVEIYRGKPYGLNIACVMMENDFGDPNRFRDEVETAVKVNHEIGKVALGFIPIVGPALAWAAAEFLDDLMPQLAAEINNLLDTDDDRIGVGGLTLSARQLVLLAARTGNSTWKNIGFKAESPLLAGHGASYKLYFGVTPA